MSRRYKRTGNASGETIRALTSKVTGLEERHAQAMLLDARYDVATNTFKKWVATETLKKWFGKEDKYGGLVCRWLDADTLEPVSNEELKERRAEFVKKMSGA